MAAGGLGTVAPRYEVVRAARWPAACALACAAVSVLLLLLGWSTDTDAVVRDATLAGYVVGALGVTTFASVFRAKTNRARQDAEFRPSPVWDRLVTIALIVGLVAGVLNAYALATELAK